MGLRMDDLHAPTVASGPTSQATAKADDKPKTLPELMTQKENLEAELSALGSVLDSHGVNMTTSLLTFDGFPRSDIDVAQIRTTRARIIRLKTDYKAVMADLEAAVHESFANAANAPPEQAPVSAPPSTHTADTTLEPPFAKVISVAEDSPAWCAGLQAGDKVIRFGPVNFANHERLSKLAQAVQHHQNRVMRVKVLRESSTNSPSQTVELRLSPRLGWGGRGMLGCHIVSI